MTGRASTRAGEEPPSWRALALSDLFLVYVELTVTEAERMKTFASVVHFMDVADVKATSQIDDAGVTLRFGSGDVTVPWREFRNGQPPPTELAFWAAVTSRLAT